MKNDEIACPDCWIDPEILPLVRLINSTEGFQTTFSCAGYGVSRRGTESSKHELVLGAEEKIDSCGDDSFIICPSHEAVSFPYLSFQTPKLQSNDFKKFLSLITNFSVKLPQYPMFSFGEPDVKLFRVEPRASGLQVVYTSLDVLGAFLLIQSVVADECIDWEEDALGLKKLWIDTMMQYFEA